MGVFDDKRYEELDWISQATEPIESPLNTALSILPDEFDINISTLLTIADDYDRLDISKDNVINFLIKREINSSTNKIPSLSWEERETLAKNFSLVVEGQPIINFVDNTITNGSISLIKEVNTIDEKTLGNLLGRNGLSAIRDTYHARPHLINEVLELLGNSDAGIRSRSFRKKKHFLLKRLADLMKNNEWNIKSSALADKVGIWIARYITDGDLSALSNFCRLKVMTHKGLPIYSMEEVE